MRKLFLPIVFSLLATAANAQRPSTLAMTCDEAIGLVAEYGSIVLSTGEHTYNRFVASRNLCFRGEHGWPSHAPTRDVAQCRVGYICKPGRSPFEDEF